MRDVLLTLEYVWLLWQLPGEEWTKSGQRMGRVVLPEKCQRRFWYFHGNIDTLKEPLYVPARDPSRSRPALGRRATDRVAWRVDRRAWLDAMLLQGYFLLWNWLVRQNIYSHLVQAAASIHWAAGLTAVGIALFAVFIAPWLFLRRFYVRLNQVVQYV